ncbi:MAG: hypothetical protein HAW67_01340 [Endozoicomonadaceae bacterium]|nr:hypothetical protein [Endozoicomonadaceae bacterium]
MDKMTFDDYKVQIDQWTAKVNEKGFMLTSGKPVPFSFWKTFLGMARRNHQDFYNGTHRNKTGMIPAYLVRSMKYINLLSDTEFFKQVKSTLPEFESDKWS